MCFCYNVLRGFDMFCVKLSLLFQLYSLLLLICDFIFTFVFPIGIKLFFYFESVRLSHLKLYINKISWYSNAIKKFMNVTRKLPSSPAKASGSMKLMLLPSSSREFSTDRCENTLAGTDFNLLWASPSESKFFSPANRIIIYSERSGTKLQKWLKITLYLRNPPHVSRQFDFPATPTFWACPG